MNTSLRVKFGALLLALVGLSSGAALAQSFSLGSDLVSRYVWRGFDFGESFSIQPALTFSAGGLEIGTWASYAVAADGGGNNELDFWIGYTVEAGAAGSFSLGVTDYYFPAPGTEFFDFNDGAGSHTIEPYVSYTGPASFPVTLLGAVNAYNDADHSVYLEASYPFQVDGVELGLTAGMTPAAGAYSDGLAFVNLGLSATKALQLNEAFALPVSVAYILNPDTERSFLVFGLGISL